MVQSTRDISVIRCACRNAFVLTLLGLSCTTNLPTSASLGTGAVLAMDRPIEREIKVGEVHTYSIEASPNSHISGVVEQLGSDVHLVLYNPAGQKVAAFDSPNGLNGPEPWSFDSTKTGSWRIEVASFPDSPTGRYRVSLSPTISAEAFAEQQAAVHFQSPRLFALWKAYREEGAVAIERFFGEIQGKAPLIEPKPNDPHGDVLVTFVRRIEPMAEYAELVLPFPPMAISDRALSRFEQSDLAYITLHLPKDTRMSYAFQIGQPPKAGASPQALAAHMLKEEPDILNPRRFYFRSLLELPDAPIQPWNAKMADVPSGHMVDRTIYSAILAEERTLGIYLPANFAADRGPYPYVILFDGQVYGHGDQAVVPTPIILDNLIAHKKVPPLVLVFVDTLPEIERRNQDLNVSPKFGQFLATELVPWLQREYAASTDPSQAILAGSSAGGYCAMSTAFEYPQVFGNVLSQSGAFFLPQLSLPQMLDNRYHADGETIMRKVLNSPTRPLRIWMEVGLLEGESKFGPVGSNMLAQNRHMRNLLLAKGYFPIYREYAGSHDYACWSGGLADGLIALTQTQVKP